MYILNLIDHHGATFVVYILGIGQIIGVSWIYGNFLIIELINSLTVWGIIRNCNDS